MQILSGALVLSFCISAAVAHNQDGRNAAEAGRSVPVIIWEEPIQFVTKNKDRCSLTLTGNGDLTRFRVSCVGQQASYWCEYEGKPDICRNYNTNPRHFFTQIMWELRKLNNACQGPRIIKPTMCKKASDESQMIMTSPSSATVVQALLKAQAKPVQAKPQAPTTAPRSDQAKPEQKPRQKPTKPKFAKLQPTRPSSARPAKAKAEPEKPVASKPVLKTTTTTKRILEPKAATTTQAPTTTSPVPTRSADTLAQQYCWHGMQDFCTKVIGWFTK